MYNPVNSRGMELFKNVAQPIDDERSPRWIALGQEIAARRSALGKRRGSPLTQQEIARKVGLSIKQLSRIETGKSGTDYDTLSNIADALEYSDAERSALFRIAWPQVASEMVQRQMVVREGDRLIGIGRRPDGSDLHPPTEAEVQELIEQNRETNERLKRMESLLVSLNERVMASR
jgi:transcriptional regulator with XRE-family HTH domain